MKRYIDIGVNLAGSSFKTDIEQVIERAQQAGVIRLIVTGTDCQLSRQAINLAESHEGICYATVGLHPHHASDLSTEQLDEFRELLNHEKAVAVGECGLDYNRNYSTRQEQIDAFEAQLEIAIETQKPLFLHQRDAHEDFLAMIKNCRADLGQVVAHCFTGGNGEVEDYLQQDMYIGVTGWVCDERRGKSLQQAVKKIPLNRIMLETDAPYLLPRDLTEKPVKKNRNEPCYLPHIAHRVAHYMDVNEIQLMTAAYNNTVSFFNLSCD